MSTEWLTRDEREEVIGLIRGCRTYDGDLRKLGLQAIPQVAGALPPLTRPDDQLRSDVVELNRLAAIAPMIRPPLVDWLEALATILKAYAKAAGLRAVALRVLQDAGLWSPPDQTLAELLQQIEVILNRGAGLRSALSQTLRTGNVGQGLLGAPVDVMKALDGARGMLRSATERAALRDLTLSLVHWLIDWAGLVQRGQEQLAAGQPLTLPLITRTLAELFTAALESRSSAYQPPPPDPTALALGERHRSVSAVFHTGILSPTHGVSATRVQDGLQRALPGDLALAFGFGQGRYALAHFKAVLRASADQRWYLVCEPDEDEAGLRPHLEAAAAALGGLHLLHLVGPSEDEPSPLTIDEEFDLAVLLTRIVATCPAGET